MSALPVRSLRHEQPYVTIPIEVTLREWQCAQALFEELFDWLAEREIEMAGPPFLRYWVLGGVDAAFGLEVGVPVHTPIAGDRRVFADAIPGGEYATLIHDGHPDGLGASHARLLEWAESEGIPLDRVAREGREVWGGRYEFYLTNPADEPDLSRWRTEIVYRIREEAGSELLAGVR